MILLTKDVPDVSIGLFGFGFLAGVSSYKNTCVEKIMKLENSRLADQVRATQMYV